MNQWDQNQADSSTPWQECTKMIARATSGTAAVLVRDGVALGAGASRAPLPGFHERFGCVRKRLHIPSGRGYSWCPGCASPSQHAEVRCIRSALDNGHRVEGSIMFLTHWHACDSCLKLVEESQVSLVFLGEIK